MALRSNWKAYVVVLEAEIDEVNCIPITWIVPNEDDEDEDELDDDEDNFCEGLVDYRFPSRNKLGKAVAFKINQPPNKKWPVLSGKAIVNTNSKREALAWVKRIKAQQRELDKELNFLPSRGGSSRDLSNTSSDAEEENPPGPSGTKKKKKEQENNHQNIQDESNENVNSLSETIDTKELHTHCHNFYTEFNASFQKTMSSLDNTADFLKKIISKRKDNVAAKI